MSGLPYLQDATFSQSSLFTTSDSGTPKSLKRKAENDSSTSSLQEFDHALPVKRSLTDHSTVSPPTASKSNEIFVTNAVTSLSEIAHNSKPNGNENEKDSEAGVSNNASTRSSISSIEGYSDSSDDDTPGESKWLPVAGPMSWVQRQMAQGVNPRAILAELIPDQTIIPDDVHDVMLWKIIVSILSEPPKRKKLDTVNTIDDVLKLIQSSSKIIVLTGAGVSVSCGIPDFRSRDGLYARLSVEYPDLPNPQAMFDIEYFKRNPYPFFKFAKEIYPGKFQPSPSHKFIKLIESQGKLLKNYAQNIDTLEQVAGINKVINCHGSFAGATCMACKHKVACDAAKDDIMNQVIPRCPVCPPGTELAILKPDIVFFGESLPEAFHNELAVDKEVCDLLIVIGSSLKVRPVSLIPNSLPSKVPQILINREPLSHQTFDVELLGDCDVIISELVRRLSWPSVTKTSPLELKQIDQDALKSNAPTVPNRLPSQFVSLRLPTSISESVSLLSDIESSHVSSMPGEYSTAMEGSQLSILKGLNMNSRSVCDPSCMSSDNSAALSHQISPTPSPLTHHVSTLDPEAGSSTAPSFIGKLNESKRNMTTGSDSDPCLPEISSSLFKIPKAERKSISTRLPEGTFLFIEPSRYVFPGAEVFSDSDNEDSDNDDDLSMSDQSCDQSDDQSTSQKEDGQELNTSSKSDNVNDCQDSCDAEGEDLVSNVPLPSDRTNLIRLGSDCNFLSPDEDAHDSFPDATQNITHLASSEQDNEISSMSANSNIFPATLEKYSSPGT